MTAADVPNQALYAEIARQLDAADRARHELTARAFERLRQADPELVQLGVQLMETDECAAWLFANQRIDRFPNSYAALAAGKRDRIVSALNRTIQGVVG